MTDPEAQRAQFQKPDELAVNIVEYLENEEIGCQLSDAAILEIRYRVRAAYAAGAADTQSATIAEGHARDGNCHNEQELEAHPLSLDPYPPKLPHETEAEQSAAMFYKNHPEFWIHPLASSVIAGDKDRATILVHKAMAAWAAEENESCAKIVETFNTGGLGLGLECEEVSKAIRARQRRNRAANNRLTSVS